MTQDFDGPVSEGIDTYVDIDSIKENPIKYLNSVNESLRTDVYKDYTLSQLQGIEVYVDVACEHLSNFNRPHFMNERIYIWSKIADLKQKQGYVASIQKEEDNEPITKK